MPIADLSLRGARLATSARRLYSLDYQIDDYWDFHGVLPGRIFLSSARYKEFFGSSPVLVLEHRGIGISIDDYAEADNAINRPS